MRIVQAQDVSGKTRLFYPIRTGPHRGNWYRRLRFRTTRRKWLDGAAKSNDFYVRVVTAGAVTTKPIAIDVTP